MVQDVDEIHWASSFPFPHIKWCLYDDDNDSGDYDDGKKIEHRWFQCVL